MKRGITMHSRRVRLCLLAGLVLVMSGMHSHAQELHAWCYARFESVEGRIEICPAGQVGAVVVHSEWPSDLLAGSPAIKDAEGRKWEKGDYERLTYQYSKKQHHFVLTRVDYRQKELLPVWRSWDFGHTMNLESLLPSYLGRGATCPLPKGAKVKWIEPVQIAGITGDVVIWEPSSATELNVWLVTKMGTKPMAVSKLLALEQEGFQGLQVMDCLGDGHRDIVLYTLGIGARYEFPAVYLIRISSDEGRHEIAYKYGFDPSHWIMDGSPSSKPSNNQNKKNP